MHPLSSDESDKTVIWIWSHTVADGAGKKAEHFDLLSQDHYQLMHCNPTNMTFIILLGTDMIILISSEQVGNINILLVLCEGSVAYVWIMKRTLPPKVPWWL